MAEKDDDSLDLAGSISEITQDAVSNLDKDSEKSEQEGESQEKSKTESSSPTDDNRESTGPEPEELIEDLQQIYENKGWLPKANDIRKLGKYSFSEYNEELGSVDEALKAAGIEKRKELLDELERVWSEIGEEPSSTDMYEHGKCSVGMYSDYFGSWTKAKEKLEDERGIPTLGPDENAEYPTFEDISGEGRIRKEIPVRVKEIKPGESENIYGVMEVEDLNGKSLRMDIWREHDVSYEFEQGKYYLLKNTRVDTWSQGKRLRSTRGLEVSEYPISSEKNPQDEKQTSTVSSDIWEPSERELLEELRQIDAHPFPNVKDIEEKSEYSISEYEKKFESLDNALEKAGVVECSSGDATGPEDQGQERKIFDEGSETVDTESSEDTKSPEEPQGDSSESSDIDEAESDEEILAGKIDDVIDTIERDIDNQSSSIEKHGSADASEEKGGPQAEELKKELQEIQSEKGRFPKAGDIREVGNHTIHEYVEEFGSLDEALKAAGIDKGQQLIDEIKKVWKELGRKPSSTEFNRHSRFDSAMVSTYFGSWSEAIEKVDGDSFERTGPTREELIYEIEDISSEVIGIPSTEEVEKNGEYSISEYEEEFGSIDKALEVSDVDISESLLEEDLVEELEGVSKELESVLQASGVNETDEYEKEVYNH